MNFDLKPYIEKFNALELRARYLAFGAAIAVFVLLDYALVLNFQLRVISGMGQNIANLSAQTLRVKSDIQRLNQMTHNLDQARAQFQSVSGKIHALTEVSGILEEIAAKANECQVAVDQIVPAKEGPQGLLTAGDVKYYALPIVVSAHSGYHMFGRFLSKLQEGNLLFMVQDLHMQSQGKQGRLDILATLQVVLVGPAAAEPLKTPGKKK